MRRQRDIPAPPAASTSEPRRVPNGRADHTAEPRAGDLGGFVDGRRSPARRVSRRAFLATLGAGAGAMALGRPAGARAEAVPAQGRRAIGVQLYTLRDMMQRDVQWTLREVAAIGYREVEFAGLFDTSPRRMATFLERTRLTAPSSHIPLARFRSSLTAVVDEAQTLGNRYVVCPWIDAGERRDADGYKRVAADFNRIGESLRRVGLQFAYHNHDFEFQPLPDGRKGFDILLAECDPALVRIQLDLFWITKGGGDPLAYFARWPGRFPSVHVKDMSSNGTMVNVGRGRIDWLHILSRRREAGIEHFFVEHDHPPSPLADVRDSFRYMLTLGI